MSFNISACMNRDFDQDNGYSGFSCLIPQFEMLSCGNLCVQVKGFCMGHQRIPVNHKAFSFNVIKRLNEEIRVFISIKI